MKKEQKSRAFHPRYESPGQLVLEGFESPFSRTLNPNNRWVVLAGLIPWDSICSLYRRQHVRSGPGRKPLNSRIVIGSLIIKYMLNLDDRNLLSDAREKAEKLIDRIYNKRRCTGITPTAFTTG